MNVTDCDSTAEPRLSLSGPLHVELALTSTCQLTCRYCSAMPLRGTIAPTAGVLSLVHQLGDMGAFSLLLSGGEPTLHPHFMDVVSACSRRIPEVTVHTNGIAFSDQSFVEAFVSAAPGVIVSVSLDSPNPMVNDSHRGRGGREAIDAIDHLTSLGKTVSISCVLTGTNFETALHLIDQFFPRVRVFKFFPRVPRNSSDIALNNSHYWKHVDEFFARARGRSEAREGPRVVLPMTEAGPDERGLISENLEYCCCAFTKVYINSELEVFPCYYSANADTCIGNLAEESMSSIWNGVRAQRCRLLARSRALCGTSLPTPSIPHRYSKYHAVSVARSSNYED